jgi:hypothetical protein
MKNYILFTNTKDKYHAHSLEFNDFYLLWKHLQEEFYFEKWDVEEVIKDFYEFMRDTRDVGIYNLSINDFIIKHFGLLNTYDFDIDLFDSFCEGEFVLISTFYDWRMSYILPLRDMNSESDFTIKVFNELLSKHGTTTSPVGVVNVYEIVAVEENIEGQEELDLPF